MKSLILSLILTVFVFYTFMTLIDPNSQSWMSKMPTWTAYPIIIIVGIAYLVALYWGVVGIMQGQRMINFLGILLSLFGIGLFVLGFSMEMGRGKAKEGQFDTTLNDENTQDITIIKPILEQAHLTPASIKMLTFWDLIQSQDTLAICMQKGRIIGISIKNVALTDVSCLSKLPELSAVTINHCGLVSLQNLRLLRAERLNLNHNLLENLNGIDAPNVKWLDVENNKLTTLEGINKLPQAQYFNYGGNAISDFSAVQNHPFLKKIPLNP